MNIYTLFFDEKINDNNKENLKHISEVRAADPNKF